MKMFPASDTVFGLSAGTSTENVDRAMRFARESGR